MLSIFNNLQLDIFGESHAEEIGMTLGGIPKDIKISKDAIQSFVNRRKAGNSPWSTPRKEADIINFTSGIIDGKTDGKIIRAVIKNQSQKSKDYNNLRYKPRPSHADYPAMIKYKKSSLAGGGKYSGRMTAPLCIAGGIAIEILRQSDIELGAYISSIYNIDSKSYKDNKITLSEISKAQTTNFPVLDREAKQKMLDKIKSVQSVGDSLGGVIECIIYGLPVGLGDALSDGLESRISASVFAVPAVKGIEFGSGFDITHMSGKNANDALEVKGGEIQMFTNHNGGINGGISNGMPLTFRVAIKPTPSISLPQKTVNLSTMQNTTIEIKGRHDTCIVPRAVPCIEAAAALAVLDAFIDFKRGR